MGKNKFHASEVFGVRRRAVPFGKAPVDASLGIPLATAGGAVQSQEGQRLGRPLIEVLFEDEMKRETFPARLARLRKAAGLSQRQLAKDAGVSQQAVNLLERGLRDPTLGTLRALAGVLGVEASELIHGTK